MVEPVRVLDEFGLVVLDAQLHLDYDFVPVQKVYFDVFGHVLQSAPHVDDLEQVRLLVVEPLQLVVQGSDFILSGIAPAAEQIVNEKGNEHRDLVFFADLDAGVLAVEEVVVGVGFGLLAVEVLVVVFFMKTQKTNNSK